MYMYSLCYSFGLDFSRYVSSVTIFANTRLHAKSRDRNSLPSHLARCLPSAFFLRFFASRFDRDDRIYDISPLKSMNIFNHRAQRKLVENRAYKTKVLNRRAPRHSIHRSVSLEANQYKLPLEIIMFLLMECKTERSDCHFNFRFVLKYAH